MKLVRGNVQNAIFTKKILKGKGASITKNPTKKRIIEMKSAQETYSFKNIWLQDGKIL